MKVFCKGTVLLLAGLCGTVLSAASTGNALLQLQKSPSAAGPWQSVPASVLSLTPEGFFTDELTNGSFYRLKIGVSDVSGGPLGLPVATADARAVQQALAMLAVQSSGPWANAGLAPYAYPVYDPLINGGQAPAYLEFKVVPGSVTGVTNAVPVTPLAPNSDLGYILVSLTTQDVPVPEMAQSGPTRVEQLRRAANGSSLRAVRYGHGCLAAEDGTGNVVAVLGQLPNQMSLALLDVGSSTFSGAVLSNTLVAGTDPLPGTTGGTYGTYAQFKQDYLSSPLYAYMAARRAEAGNFRWNLESDLLPPILKVPLGTQVQVLTDQSLTGFDIEDTSVAMGWTTAVTGGMWLKGLTPGGTILHVVLPDRSTAYYAIQVTPTGGAAPKGWSAWSYYYAGSCTDQRRYYQVWALCHSGCYSGCGPTAWGMLYGWWDQRGPFNLIGGAGPTPLYNDANVNACLQAVCGYCGTWCSGSSGVTNPWDEYKGYLWAGARSESISESWCWGVPYVCSCPRNCALGAIRAGHPAIVGTGFYAHYPLAWGYAYREYKLFGIVWSRQYHWLVNEGWGGDPCAGDWVNADDCWFGNDTTCW